MLKHSYSQTMSIVNNNPGFCFPVAHPYDSDAVPSLPIIPMPQPQPFQHGTVVFGQPGGYPSPRAPGGGFWDQRQERYFPPQHLGGGPPEDFNPQPQGQTSRPAPFPLPSSIGLEIEPHVLHISAPYSGPSEAQQPQPVKIQLGADDIKPNVYHFSHLADAVRELGTCKTIFEQCDDKLVNDLYVSNYVPRVVASPDCVSGCLYFAKKVRSSRSRSKLKS